MERYVFCTAKNSASRALAGCAAKPKSPAHRVQHIAHLVSFTSRRVDQEESISGCVREGAEKLLFGNENSSLQDAVAQQANYFQMQNGRSRPSVILYTSPTPLKCKL